MVDVNELTVIVLPTKVGPPIRSSAVSAGSRVRSARASFPGKSLLRNQHHRVCR
jgi:hypothetical protein